MSSIIAPPPVPSKWEIIPIHASDLGTYKFCRRRWDWSSPARHNLRRKVTIYGVNPALWFGTGIHYALQNYYDPALQRDPVESFKTWYQWQVDGGIVTEDELDQVLDIEPQPVTRLHDAQSGLLEAYQVRGLRELLPDFFEDEWQELYDLGVGMMTFYTDYAKREDTFEVIAAESQFSIPLGFEAIDTREESPNYGNKLEVHARGKRDAIIRLYESGRFAIIDHKTAASIGDEYFTKLEKDPQCSTYLWASQEEAKLHGLPYTTIEYVLYNVLRKVYPKPPSVLSDGIKPSLDRQKESTTAKMFADYIKESGLVQWYEDNTKAQNYYNWLVEQGDKNFVMRDYAYRNVHEAYNTGEQIRMVAQEMLSDPLIYPNPTGDYSCLKCPFRAPCIAKDDGSDWQYILNDGYEKNRDR